MEHDNPASRSISHLEAPRFGPNPRRTPSDLSKSLPRHKKQKLAHSGRGQQEDTVRSISGYRQQTSQDSDSAESASKWFDKANEHVATAPTAASTAQDDPPFFLTAQEPSQSPDSPGSDEIYGAGNRCNTENEELRGVIDDLVLENKSLKRLLKNSRYTSKPPPDPNDKLFELRVHGLDAEKKRELEVLLRNFTAKANGSWPTSSSSAKQGSSNPSNKSRSDRATSNQLRHHSSGALPTDSGYGSNARSGPASAAVSLGGTPSQPVSSKSRNKSIKTYLQDMPDTLLPRQSIFISEEAKQILVVRRLEQLFTGQLAEPGEHSQPMQQQEVSRSAARSEAKPGRMTKVEGSREAHMLSHDDRPNLEGSYRQQKSTSRRDNPGIGRTISSESTSSASLGEGSPDQRPTRPLDLDIHRAQVASDNIGYIRHLGLSTPHITADGGEKDQSWMYLNLLISMAQLHTLNVTPAFIRKAIKKLSTKFDLSEDGKQVRWRGGNKASTFANIDVSALQTMDQASAEVSDDTGGLSGKRSKTNSSSNAVISDENSSADKTSGLQTHATDSLRPRESTAATSHLQTGSTNALTRSNSTFDYKPLIYRGKKYPAAASYLDSTGSSSPVTESAGLLRMMSDSSLGQSQRSQEGMITFYSNSYFCCDVSADKSLVNGKLKRRIDSWEGLGMEHEQLLESPLRYHDACYFTPQFAPKPSIVDAKIDIAMDLHPISTAGEPETQPIELDASGIGGITPEDNFAIDVKVLRELQACEIDGSPSSVTLSGSRKWKRYSYRTVDCDKIELQPSRLPPPSYIFFTSSSSSTTADPDDSDSDSSSSADEDSSLPAAFLNRWSTGSSDVESVAEDESGFIDMLEFARAADPAQVAAQERAYILNRPQTMEGSLAATAGASRRSSVADDADSNAADGQSNMSLDRD